MTDRTIADWRDVPAFGLRPKADVAVIRPSAYGLIGDGRGRLALVRTGGGTFLPGGGIEAGETPEAAIQREALEECGLVIRPGAWAVRAVQYAYAESERIHFEKRCTFIDGSIERAGLAPSEADHELLWIRPDEAIRKLSHESQSWAVERWNGRTIR
jgi:8-oxo-dGTP diphosphatase